MYPQNETCMHHKAISENDSNRMCLFGIATRNLSPVQAEYRNQRWKTFCIPCEEQDYVRLLVVFKGSALPTTFSTSGIVMIDMHEFMLRKHV